MSYNPAFGVFRAMSNLGALERHESSLWEFKGKKCIRRPSKELRENLAQARDRAATIIVMALQHVLELETYDELNELYKGTPEAKARKVKKGRKS